MTGFSAGPNNYEMVKVKCDHRSKFSNLSNWKEDGFESR